MDVSVLSILTVGTVANPVNKVVQLLSDLETKTREGVEVKQIHERSLIGVSRKKVILLCAVQTEQADEEAQLAQLAAASKAKSALQHQRYART